MIIIIIMLLNRACVYLNECNAYQYFLTCALKLPEKLRLFFAIQINILFIKAMSMDYAGLQRLTEEQDKAFKNSEEELKKW